jgi:predicted transcriptional regulator
MQREPIEIKMDLCEFLFNRARKVTKIEHACNLRDDLCKQYLAELVDLQFIRKNENDEYEIMERGIGFLSESIDLFRTHFPERRKKLEGDRIWMPIIRVPKPMKEAPQTSESTM